MGWFWKVGLLGGKGQYLIGAGGWAYFRTPGEPSLVAYSRMFNFVEVNSTFYEIPAQSEAERWRRLVPDDFEFAVRVHRSITHEHRLQPSRESLENLERLRRISEILRAEVMHFQRPPTLKIDRVHSKPSQPHHINKYGKDQNCFGAEGQLHTSA